MLEERIMCGRAWALVIPMFALSCVRYPKMDVSAPVQIKRAPFDVAYMQSGERIDPRDMMRRLDEDPEASPYVRRARTWGTLGMITGAAGGALVGWPIGRALGGDPNPPWILAAIGGGLIVVTIPIGIATNNAVDGAVEIHNRKVQTELE